MYATVELHVRPLWVGVGVSGGREEGAPKQARTQGCMPQSAICETVGVAGGGGGRLLATIPHPLTPVLPPNPPLYPPPAHRCDPHGAPNLLTGSATESWKAVRRAVAVSFSTQNIKKKYPLILSRINELVTR